MPLQLSDEDVHPRGEGEHYGENYLFAGLGEDSDVGFYIHTSRLFGIGAFELHIAAFAEGKMVSCLIREDLNDDGMARCGFSYSIKEPFKRWNLAFAGAGRAGAFLASGESDIPLELDIDFDGPLPPLDMAEVFRAASFGQMKGEHYEQGFSWQGRVTVGDSTFQVKGLGIRDHSWGSRHMTEHNTTWWAPSTFDRGEIFHAGLDMRRGANRTAFSARSDSTGDHIFDEMGVTVLEGDQVTFRKAELTFGEDGPYTATQVARVPVPWLVGHGLLRVSDDVFCRLTRPDGSAGFCLLEMNRALTEAETVGFGATVDRRTRR